MSLSVRYVPAYCPEWDSSRLAIAPWRRMASAVQVKLASEPGVCRSRWKAWEPSVSGWTMHSLTVTAAAPPLARSS